LKEQINKMKKEMAEKDKEAMKLKHENEKLVLEKNCI